MFPAAWCLLSFIMISPHTAGMLYKTNFRNFKTQRFRLSQLTQLQKETLYQSFLQQYHLYLYDWLTTEQQLDMSDIFRNPPPSLLHLTGYGDDFEKFINTTPSLFYTRQPDKHQPTIQLLSEVPSSKQRHVYLSNDYFNPNFSAILRSEVTSNDDTFQVICDTGCSFAMTHDPTDFVSEPVYDNWGSVQTASDSLPLTALGTIQWSIQTTEGKDFTLTVPGFLVPGSNVRLLSPQDYVRYHKLSNDCDQYGGNASSFWLTLQDNKSRVSAAITTCGNLPVMHASRIKQKPSKCGCLKYTSAFNTTPAQDRKSVV